MLHQTMETIIPAFATTSSFSALACVPTWPRHYPVFFFASRAFPPLSPASSLPSSPGTHPSHLLSLLIRLVRTVSLVVAEGFVPGPVSPAEHALGRMGRVVRNQLRRASDSRQLACAYALGVALPSDMARLRSSPYYRKAETAVLPPKAIASDLVHPAPALIRSRLRIVPLHVCGRINVHVIVYIAKFRVIFCGPIFELPVIRRNVVPRNRHVERAMHEERYVIRGAEGHPPS
jgi:hypothetical protein